ALRFDEAHDIVYKPFRTLPFHPNGMRCMAMDESGSVLLERSYYSVGGGFVVQGDAKADPLPPRLPDMAQLPRPFPSGEDLLRRCLEHKCSISDVMRAEEREWRSDAETEAGLARSRDTMPAGGAGGASAEGRLP